jgi:hypothetical protein
VLPPSRRGNLDVEYNRAIQWIQPLADWRYEVETVDYPGGGNARKEEFSVIIWAAGHGKEDCTAERRDAAGNLIGRYTGRSFWEYDPYNSPNCGVPGVKAEVVIAGSGDGSLQDFLRVVTQKAAASHFYNTLAIPPSLEQELHCVEDLNHRAQLWATPDRLQQPHVVQQQVHDRHLQVVEQALKVPSVTRGLRQHFASAPQNVKLVYRCKHFTAYYGLNRFVVLLLAEWFRKSDGVEVLVPERRIAYVTTPDGHDCNVLGPIGCHGKEHRVHLEVYPECYGTAQGAAGHFDCNVLIIRYGPPTNTVPQPPLLGGYQAKLALERPRHSLPYHAPKL